MNKTVLRRFVEVGAPAIACLIVAGCIASAIRPVPPQGLVSFALLALAQFIGIAGMTLLYVAITLAGYCAVLLAGHAVLRVARLNTQLEALRPLQGSTAAVCIPALLLFAMGGPGWVFATVSVLFTVNFLQVFVAIQESIDTHGSRPEGAIPSSPDRRPWWYRFAAACLVSLCVHLGLLAGLLGSRFAAGMLFSASAGLMTCVIARPRLSFIPRFLITTTLAVAFTAAGLLQYFFVLRLGEKVPFTIAMLRVFSSTRLPRFAQNTSREARREQSTESRFEARYSGVILLPENKRDAILLVPPPDALFRPAVMKRETPYSIEFNGVYWVFKPPNVQPPKRAFTTHGNPAKVSLHSSDAYPLLMEAHQSLATPMNINCCAEIQVAIRNADPHPETIALELRLGTARLRGIRFQSLGGRMLSSTGRSQSDTTIPIEQVLTFPVPRSSSIRRFDEIIVLFHLDPRRAGQSAQVAIERFTFIPRH